MDLLCILCANAYVDTGVLKVSSYRVFQQIPAGSHTHPTCGVYLILRVQVGNDVFQGSALDHSFLILLEFHTQIVQPTFFKSHDTVVQGNMHMAGLHTCSCEEYTWVCVSLSLPLFVCVCVFVLLEVNH